MMASAGGLEHAFVGPTGGHHPPERAAGGAWDIRRRRGRMRAPKTIKNELDIDRILQILPHRWPFVMVDRVTEVVPHELIRGHKCVSFNEPWFLGHFPRNPIMPGVLVIEALAQIGGILAYASEPFDEEASLLYFLGIDKAKFRRPVVPGDRLDLEVTVMHHRTNVWKLKGEASVDGTLCAQSELLASVVDRGG
jgi:3-hydroxyacyl-[acyl-carrier-protein] dehydratase